MTEGSRETTGRGEGVCDGRVGSATRGGGGQVNAPGLAAAEGEADISGGRAAVARARSGDVLR
jgi:hypothetical protein